MAGMRPICPQIVQDEDLRLDQHQRIRDLLRVDCLLEGSMQALPMVEDILT